MINSTNRVHLAENSSSSAVASDGKIDSHMPIS